MLSVEFSSCCTGPKLYERLARTWGQTALWSLYAQNHTPLRHQQWSYSGTHRRYITILTVDSIFQSSSKDGLMELDGAGLSEAPPPLLSTAGAAMQKVHVTPLIIVIHLSQAGIHSETNVDAFSMLLFWFSQETWILTTSLIENEGFTTGSDNWGNAVGGSLEKLPTLQSRSAQKQNTNHSSQWLLELPKISDNPLLPVGPLAMSTQLSSPELSLYPGVREYSLWNNEYGRILRASSARACRTNASIFPASARVSRNPETCNDLLSYNG